MRRSKAISPMIAIVLLIAFTVAVIGIITIWGTGLLGTTTGAVESGTEYKIKCSTVLLQLKNIKYYGDTRTGLVGYWKFDNTTTPQSYANDSSGNGNTGTLTNMNTTGNETSGWTTDCKYGSCLKFDGVNDYVGVSFPSSSTYTVAMWFYPRNRTADQDLIGIYSGDFYKNELPLNINGGNLRGVFQSSPYVCSVSIPSANAWYFAVLTASNGSSATLYLYNSTGLVGSSTRSGTTWAYTSNTKYIGTARRGAWRYFNGTIDDVRIYNRALSAGEIQDEYQYQSFIRGLLLHSGGAESVNNATITAAGGGYVSTATAFATSAFDPGSGYSFTINTTGGVSTAPDIISVTAKCGNIGVVGECAPGQGCMSSG